MLLQVRNLDVSYGARFRRIFHLGNAQSFYVTG